MVDMHEIVARGVLPGLLLGLPGLLALSVGCLRPNPMLVDEGGTGSTADDTSSGDGDPTGDGDGDTTGDGDGEPTGDGDGEPDTCNNNQLDENETDIDCGGNCGPCDDGDNCTGPNDCVSQVCSASQCQPASCEDQVQNGAEAGIDCGGTSCPLCSYGAFVAELDDFQASDARHPRAAMFDDGSFALTYSGPIDARARWFDEFGVASADSIELSPDIDFALNRPIPIAAGAGLGYPIHVLEAGTDAPMSSTDLFLLRLTQAGYDVKFRINPTNQLVEQGDLVVDGTLATINWVHTQQVYTRRFDYDIGGGSWIDIDALSPEPMPGLATGEFVAFDRNAAGVGVVAWVRCGEGQWPCDIAVRRFDSDWIDPAPIVAPALPDEYPGTEPRVAIADDGRVAVLIRAIGLEQSSFAGWILDDDLISEGPVWMLQTDIPHDQDILFGDVEALSDGSFVFGWPDPGQDRVHLRRYVSANEPKIPALGDESPWSTLDSPNSVSIASVEGRAVVVWSAVVDGIRQIQGQVFSF